MRGRERIGRGGRRKRSGDAGRVGGGRERIGRGGKARGGGGRRRVGRGGEARGGGGGGAGAAEGGGREGEKGGETCYMDMIHLARAKKNRQVVKLKQVGQKLDYFGLNGTGEQIPFTHEAEKQANGRY